MDFSEHGAVGFGPDEHSPGFWIMPVASPPAVVSGDSLAVVSGDSPPAVVSGDSPPAVVSGAAAVGALLGGATSAAAAFSGAAD